MNKAINKQKQKLNTEQLVTLLDIKDRAYELDSPNELAVYACNEPHKIATFFQSISWHVNRFNKIEVLAVSGISRVDPQALVTQFIVTLVKRCLKLKTSQQSAWFSINDINDEQIKKTWDEHLPPYCHWMPFTKDGDVDAGILVFYEEKPSRGEDSLQVSLNSTFSHLWYTYPENQKKRKSLLKNALKSNSNKLWILLGLIIVLCIPVRESSLAPASVVPTKPIVVSSSISGVINDIHVQPNAFVEKGQLLVSLDADKLRSDLDIAKKEYESSKAEYLVASQRAFDEGEARAQVNLLKSRSETAELSVKRAQALLDRSNIYAAQSGLAVFTDKYQFLGQRVAVGERILLLADVNAVEIDIYMPVGDTIDYQVGDDVLLFLNTDPTKAIKANLRQTSYEPSERDNGDFIFHLKAQFDSSEYNGRIGWAGTAKVYSSKKISLFMYLFRRPIASARRFLGV